VPADKVLVEQRGAVTVLTLNRPEVQRRGRRDRRRHLLLLADHGSVLGTWGRSLEDGPALEGEAGRAAARDPEMVDGVRTFFDQDRA
jgi:hypothetical protein